MEKRYIGIDLHRNRFTCCLRLENERTYVTQWGLEKLGRFVEKLRPTAIKHVAAAAPRLGQLLDRHFPPVAA